MKRLFNNPWVIAVFACLAAYIVYSNAIAPYISSDTSSIGTSDIPMFDDGTEATSAIDDSNRAIRSVNTSVLFWNETPKRDPFSPIPSITESDINKAKVIREESEQRAKIKLVKKKKTIIKKLKTKAIAEPLPILTGFISGEATKQAIINGQIVSEGERIKRYQVITIKKGGVIIRKIGERTEHTLSVSQ